MSDHIVTQDRQLHLDRVQASRLNDSTPWTDGLMTPAQYAVAVEVPLEVVAVGGGVKGQRAFDKWYMYECVADGQWKAVAIDWEWTV